MSIFSLPCLRRRRNKIREAHRRTAESQASAEHLESQWPEVRALSEWAKATREHNHLTELFIASRGRK